MITVDYLKNLKKAGFTEEQAESIVTIIDMDSQTQKKEYEQLKKSYDILREEQNSLDRRISRIDDKNLATKGDLLIVKNDLHLEIEKVRKEMIEIKLDMVKWMIGTGITTVITLGGIIAKGFHWW